MESERSQTERKMKGLGKMSSSFTLLLILILAAFSSQSSTAAAEATTKGSLPSTPSLSLAREEASASAATSTEPSTLSPQELRSSMISPDGFLDWLLKKLNGLRTVILDEMLKCLGLPPSRDILNYFIKTVTFIAEKIAYVLVEPRQRSDTVINWIIDSVFNPFRAIKRGLQSFRILYRFLHKLRKGLKAGFGKDNPIYNCFVKNHSACVSKARGSIQRYVIYQFYCAWRFYEECRIQFWFEKGKWRAPNVNPVPILDDPCKHLKRHKCSDDPPTS